MIELDANGKIPQVSRARAYVVAGYTDGKPWSGFNLWSNGGCMTETMIEDYSTFQGWACDPVLLDPPVFVDNQEPPSHEGMFRLALFQDLNLPERRYASLEQGPVQDDLTQYRGFLGWITPTFTVDLPQPVPEILVRFCAPVPGGSGVIEGLFITKRSVLDQSPGRTVNLGPQGGSSRDVVITLEPRHFTQLSHDQDYIEKSHDVSNNGTLCGVNPLVLPTFVPPQP